MESHHPSLKNGESNLIGGKFTSIAGNAMRSTSPANPDTTVWSGSPRVSDVDLAIASARTALTQWRRWPREKRFSVLRTFAAICKSKEDAITRLISDETGKVMWDARAEAQLLAAKVEITLDDSADSGLSRVKGFDTGLTASRKGICSFRPHGVMAVLGPFNFPAHLPNGHIVPALAMGNTIVLKPSDKTPAIGQLLAELYQETFDSDGVPAGVLNLVQGGADVAAAIAAHNDIDGILFTGSWAVGRRIIEANLNRPGRILALEMGGNNPAIIMPDADLKQAVIECVRSAVITSGQRCTCTRRVIVHREVSQRVIAAICKGASALAIGAPDSQLPTFMGPVISEQARNSILHAVAELVRAGGELLVQPAIVGDKGWYVSPGVMKVDRFTTGSAGAGADVEVFGPLLRISVVDSLDEAIEQANATSFGLAASIFTKDAAAIERFLNESRAGCINVNTGTAGASSKLPFGGLGQSGNHRPAGAFSLDYCAYPVGCMVETGPTATIATGMHFDANWLL